MKGWKDCTVCQGTGELINDLTGMKQATCEVEPTGCCRDCDAPLDVNNGCSRRCNGGYPSLTNGGYVSLAAHVGDEK